MPKFLWRLDRDGEQKLNSSVKPPHAIVVLPPGRAGRIRDRGLRRWLSRGRLRVAPQSGEILFDVLELIGHSAAGEGLAALRFWGQTSERSAAWMAAADPVHLEARLDHLCLHALRDEQIPLSDLRPIVDYLQKTFGSDRTAFARIGNQVYLRGFDEMATGKVSARFLDGRLPDAFMPEGSAAESLNLLVSEIQMALHEHEVNIDREQSGLRSVNSFWIWGGGMAPEGSTQPILPLFADDALFRGFWLSRTGLAEPWPDHFDACIELANKGFVAVAPERLFEGQPEAPDVCLRALMQLLKQKKIARLTLLFRDGLRAELSSIDAYRFWRRESSLVAPA